MLALALRNNNSSSAAIYSVMFQLHYESLLLIFHVLTRLLDLRSL